MKNILKITIFTLSLFSVLLLFSCAKESEVKNPEILAIYNLAVEANATDLTFDEWVKSIKGPQGEQGREVLLRVADGYIQWQYNGEIEWLNLIELELLSGPAGNDGLDGENGVDGREIVVQVFEGDIQWEYEGEDVWKTLVTLEEVTPSDYFLTDEEINHFLSNYEQDIRETIGDMDLSFFNNEEFLNECLTSTYETCFNVANYPNLYTDRFELLLDKYDSIDRLATYMGIVSSVIGEFDSTPIIPNDFITGGNEFIRVGGRNKTSVIFEGFIDSTVIPIELPIEVKMNYELLIYKSSEDDKIYVEGKLEILGGVAFIEVGAFEVNFLSTYDMDKNLVDLVYKTDAIGFLPWITVVTPKVNEVEIYATNGDKLEFFSIKIDSIEIVFAEQWFTNSRVYFYELYGKNGLIYSYTNDDGKDKYIVPMSQINGWSTVEFSEHSNWGANDFLFRISNDQEELRIGTTQTPYDEPTWIVKESFIQLYNNLGVLEKGSSIQALVVTTHSFSDLVLFVGDAMTLDELTSFASQTEKMNYLDAYSYNLFLSGETEIDVILDKFNLLNY